MGRLVRTWALMLLATLSLVAGSAAPASALKPIVIDPNEARIDITTLGDLYESHSDSLQVETAQGADGTTDRISVPATTAGTSPNWMVFALTNPTDAAIERWITADRYTVVGSGAIWPDLDARRIEAVTPSMGFAAERIKSDRADVFRITIEPGQTITYVVELASDRLARINLWKPLEYELKVRDRQLFNGIMLGLTGLLAIFLTAIFAANHKLIFPASALVAWCVLGILCVDFGFFHKLFQLRPEDNAIYRAAAEAAVASSLLIFAHTFLRLGTLPALIRMIITVWMAAQLSLIALSVIDPRLAATFSRLSFAGLGVVGAGVILLLALRGQDRAMALIPTWVMFCVWLFGTAVLLSGRVSGDLAVSLMVAGLVLVLVLIGFAVTQFAFRSRDGVALAAPNEAQLRSLALDGAGAAVWEWNARRDTIKVGRAIEDILDLGAGVLSSKTDEFISNMHPADRDRFKLMLWSIQERAGGKIQTGIRLRHNDNSYRWFEIEAASLVTEEDRQVRCLGLIRDVTDSKRAHERLLHDAVHDSLTQLPNRALFADRLRSATQRAKADRSMRPTLFFIDIDKFKTVNSSFGLVIGDSLLLTVARRLQRHLGANDTLARVGGDQFAILSLMDQNAEELASLAERIRRSLRAPIKMTGEDIVLTGSVGVAVFDAGAPVEQDLMKDAEIAMYRAKRGGADRIEIFKPEMRSDRDERRALEADLRQALERHQIRILYQPIYYLPTEQLAGFEAIVRWDHPQQGLLNPAAIIPIEDNDDLMMKLGSYVLMRAARDASAWQKEMPRGDSAPLFVCVNVTSQQAFRQVLVQEVRHIFGQNVLPRGALKLELPEALVMDNPEQSVEILEQLRGAGAELSLDDFGMKYSSLAYLSRLPFDTIKISHSLVEICRGRDADGSMVVRSLVAMARELDKKVVADGVEADEDAAFLRSIGCEFAQGYLYGDPVPERDVVSMLRRVRTSERRLKPRMFKTRSKRSADKETAANSLPQVAADARKNGTSSVGVGAASAGAGNVSRARAAAKPAVSKPAAPDEAQWSPSAAGLQQSAPKSNGQGQGGRPPPLPAGKTSGGIGPAAGPVPSQPRPDLSPERAPPLPLAVGSPPARVGAEPPPRVSMPPPVLTPTPRPDLPSMPLQSVAGATGPAPVLPAMPAAASAAPPSTNMPVRPAIATPQVRKVPNSVEPARAGGPPPLSGSPLGAPSMSPTNPQAQRPDMQSPPPLRMPDGDPPPGPGTVSPPPPIPASAFSPPQGATPPPVLGNPVVQPQPLAPDFSKLPPAIAESLARLAGVTGTPPRRDGSSS